jgi:hypothetical protein
MEDVIDELCVVNLKRLWFIEYINMELNAKKVNTIKIENNQQNSNGQ